MRDRAAGTTALASTNAAGQAANGDVNAQDAGNVHFAISGDGRYAVFASVATNLSPGDTDANKDVFRKDLTTGEVTLVSVNSAGEKANAAVGGDPDVSYAGDAVAFTSGAATNLFAGDTNNASDVVVREVSAGATALVAQTTAGVQANSTTERPAISADGRAVAFEAVNTTVNLAPNDTGNGNDIFVRNLAAGTLAAASDPSKTAGSSFPDISGDGRYVVFDTDEKYGGANDASAGNDVYRRDMGTGDFVLASARNSLAVGGNATSNRGSISTDGSRVAFASTAIDLTADANAAVTDVFTRDIGTQTTRLASVNGATQGTNDSDRGAVAANGGLATFIFTDPTVPPGVRLITTDANLKPDAFAKELAPTDTTPPGLALSGPAQGASQIASQVPVGGSVSDVSGVASLTINGVPLPLTATGGFSTSLPLVLGANAITVRATDGAGNAGEITRTVTRTGVPPATSRPRLTALKAGFSRGRLVVRVTLTANARVSVQLLRRTVKTTPRKRILLSGVNRPVIRTLPRGHAADQAHAAEEAEAGGLRGAGAGDQLPRRSLGPHQRDPEGEAARTSAEDRSADPAQQVAEVDVAQVAHVARPADELLDRRALGHRPEQARDDRVEACRGPRPRRSSAPARTARPSRRSPGPSRAGCHRGRAERQHELLPRDAQVARGAGQPVEDDALEGRVEAVARAIGGGRAGIRDRGAPEVRAAGGRSRRPPAARRRPGGLRAPRRAPRGGPLRGAPAVRAPASTPRRPGSGRAGRRAPTRGRPSGSCA